MEPRRVTKGDQVGLNRAHEGPRGEQTGAKRAPGGYRRGQEGPKGGEGSRRTRESLKEVPQVKWTTVTQFQKAQKGGWRAKTFKTQRYLSIPKWN